MMEEASFSLLPDHVRARRVIPANFCSNRGFPRVAIVVFFIGVVFCFPLSFLLRYFASCPASVQWPTDPYCRLCFAFSNCAQGLSLLLNVPLGWVLFSAVDADFSRLHRKSLVLGLSVCFLLMLSYFVVGSTTDLYVARKAFLSFSILCVMVVVVYLPRFLFRHIRAQGPVYYACLLCVAYSGAVGCFNIWGIISQYEGLLYLTTVMLFLFAILADTGRDRFLNVGYMCAVANINMGAPPVCGMLYSAALSFSTNETVIIVLWVTVIRSFAGLVRLPSSLL